MKLTAAIRPSDLQKALRKLNDVIKRKEGLSKQGLIKLGLRIESESKQRAPKDTGNLRASHFTTWGGNLPQTPSFVDKPGAKEQGGGAAVIARSFGDAVGREQAFVEEGVRVSVGVGAHYAVFVHETERNYRNGAWQFLKDAVDAVKPFALKLIAAEARRGK